MQKGKHNIEELSRNNNVKLYRLRKGYSAAVLADILDISGQHIYNIESLHIKYTPSLAGALKLAKILGVPVERLFRLSPKIEAEIELRAKRYDTKS